MAEQFRRPSASFFEHEVALQHSCLVDAVTPLEEIEELCLVVSVKALAHRLIVSLPDVQEPIAIGVKVGVEAEVLSPGSVLGVI